MIARIAGKLEEVSPNSILLIVNDVFGYEILIPSASIDKFSSMLGSDVVLHTIHIIEGDPSRGQVQPRLIGFLSESDKEFFKIFTKVKGIGTRKALRALVRPIAEIASAIESKDAKFLTTLPEIGKRTAETIIAALNGKVVEFVGSDIEENQQASSSTISLAGNEAISALVQLGERPAEAAILVERILSVAPEIDTAEEIIQQVYKIKG